MNDQNKTHRNPFRLGLSPSWLSSLIEKVLSLSILAKHYDKRPNADAENPSDHVDDFIDHTLKSMGADVSVLNEGALDNIPTEGPVIFVSNHPFGGIEGVLMTRILKKIRPDLKVLTNELLSRIPEFGDTFIGVDVLSESAAAKNAKGIRATVKHLRNKGALLIYPAGRVSYIHTSDFKIRDREWNSMVGRLMKQFDATCIPFFVHGRNSRIFYWSGLIHARLRTALLPRELAKNSRKTIKITVGDPIYSKDIRSLENEVEVTSYLRAASELLAKRPDSNHSSVNRYPDMALGSYSKEELQKIENTLESLNSCLLIRQNEFEVYCASYKELDVVMHEIAVARERTFRLAGEGTGKSSDSDRFDPHYEHLFIWDTENKRIVGSYRLGESQRIMETIGVDGLYSRSLYKFSETFVKELDGALEIGRSFVAPEYQRSTRALDLLWRGIGAWLLKHPEYRTLFGCVSISQEHSAYARAFLKESLMHSFRVEQENLNDVTPLQPLKIKDKVWTNDVLASLRNIVLINKLLGQCDPGKSIPILLRQYIAMNGRFAGFSVNKDFNDSLDGLIFVDLRKTPVKYLQRYLGKEGSQKFMKMWGIQDVAA